PAVGTPSARHRGRRRAVPLRHDLRALFRSRSPDRRRRADEDIGRALSRGDRWGVVKVCGATGTVSPLPRLRGRVGGSREHGASGSAPSLPSPASGGGDENYEQAAYGSCESIKMNATRQGAPLRLIQAWLVACCTTTSPALRCTVLSSSIMSISPDMMIA